MKGTAHTFENEIITMTPDAISVDSANEMSINHSLRSNVEESLKAYFSQLDGQTPANLWGLVMAEVEQPLIEMVLKLTNRNQSKAAIILGISRGTLRKKMAIYDIK